MDRIDRRSFLGAGAAAAGSFVGAVAASEQGDVAVSRPLSIASGGRDPLGLSSGAGDITSESVRRAIEDGVRYLKSQQLADGTWPDHPHYDGGLTPLATLALLHAGCDPDDSQVAKALEYLRSFTPRSTYTASLQTMVFCLADAAQYMPLIMRNAKWIGGRQWQQGEQIGMWATSPYGSTDHTDNSMSHFALLALYEAERAGVRVRPLVWQLALDHWRKTQNNDGSWGWGPKYPGSGSMTCAGIAAILIAGSQLDGADATVRGDDIVGCGLQRLDPSLERAVEWLVSGFSVARNPGTEFWHSYYLYALERAGRMTGQRFIGSHDWYREGARLLVATQEFSGAWPPDVEFQSVTDQRVSTSFSLMFLAKGRWPVVLAHLKHLPADDWNRHRSGLTNLIGHVERAWDRNLTHQIVDVHAATVEDLLESPVVFLNGRNAPQLSADDRKKLRMYVDRGGYLFAERCCGGIGFDTEFRKLIDDMFPEQEFKLQLLPPDHPLWFVDAPIDAEHLPPLWGVDVSCRTGVIYCPTDLSAYWELDRLGREREFSDAIQAKLRVARQVGINVLTYATGRDVEFKNPALTFVAGTLDPNQPFERGKLYVANVLHPGGCHAAPAALANLLRRASDDFRVEVSRVPREVDLSNTDLFKYHVLFMHGRAAFELTPLERERLHEYLERGGTLVADAVCSSAVFTKSFRREMREVFPVKDLARVPATDPLFSPDFGGTDVRSVSRRQLKSLLASTGAANSTIQGAPRLEGIRVGDRYGVLFSPDDLSCALETEPIGCAGYVRRDAIQIAMNVLLYALNQ